MDGKKITEKIGDKTSEGMKERKKDDIPLQIGLSMR
jgi:hypothetical protein